MLLAENMAALFAFVVWLAAFALGYALRNWTDATLADLESYPRNRKGAHDGRR